MKEALVSKRTRKENQVRDAGFTTTFEPELSSNASLHNRSRRS